MDAIPQFQTALLRRLTHDTPSNVAPVETLALLTKCLSTTGVPTSVSPAANPLREDFDEALKIAKNQSRDDVDRELIGALDGLAPNLAWFKRPSDPNAAFYQNHANAELIGKRGLLNIEGLTVGLSLMAPGTVYPDHHHPPEEVYLVLCEGQWRQKDLPWQTKSFGDYVYNPPDILHAMQSAHSPLLALWCLLHS